MYNGFKQLKNFEYSSRNSKWLNIKKLKIVYQLVFSHEICTTGYYPTSISLIMQFYIKTETYFGKTFITIKIEGGKDWTFPRGLNSTISAVYVKFKYLHFNKHAVSYRVL